jgi:hypothetical protein
MDILGATDKPNTAHSIPSFLDGFMSRFDHFGMRRKTKVIVGAKIQYRLTTHYNFCTLRAPDYSFTLIKTCHPDLFNLFRDTANQFLIHMIQL